MFTAAEVGALITAGKFLNCHGDESFIKDFDSAMYKIKSILKHGEKNYAQELENSINVYSTSGQKIHWRITLLQQFRLQSAIKG